MQVHYRQHSSDLSPGYYIQFWVTLLKGNKNYREFEGGQTDTSKEMLTEMELVGPKKRKVNKELE